MLKRHLLALAALAVVAGPAAAQSQAAYQLTGAVSLGAPEKRDYVVFDAAGHMLRSGRLSGGRTSISQLPPGIYFVRAGAYNATILLQ